MKIIIFRNKFLNYFAYMLSAYVKCLNCTGHISRVYTYFWVTCHTSFKSLHIFWVTNFLTYFGKSLFNRLNDTTDLHDTVLYMFLMLFSSYAKLIPHVLTILHLTVLNMKERTSFSLLFFFCDNFTTRAPLSHAHIYSI